MLKLAVILGLGAAAWYWRNEIGSMVETRLPGLREQTGRVLGEARESVARLSERPRSDVRNS